LLPLRARTHRIQIENGWRDVAFRIVRAQWELQGTERDVNAA